MKRFLSLLITGLFSLSFLAACGTSPSSSPSSSADSSPSSAANASGLTIVTSIYPMYDFTKKLVGDKATVVNLTPPGIEPHDWEPSSNDMITLEEADLFIYNGNNFEHWIDKTLSALSNKDKLMTVETTSNLEKENASDPHTWLNPLLAREQMAAILASLQKVDPANAQAYEDNFTRWSSEFEKLDQDYTTQLETLSRRDIVVAHEAFGYLSQAYDLNQVAIEGLSADSEPDASRMAEVIDFVKAHQVKTIFFEELVSPKVAEAIAAETGAETALLNPIEGLSEEDLAAGKDYFSVMRENLAALVKALA